MITEYLNLLLKHDSRHPQVYRKRKIRKLAIWVVAIAGTLLVILLYAAAIVTKRSFPHFDSPATSWTLLGLILILFLAIRKIANATETIEDIMWHIEGTIEKTYVITCDELDENDRGEKEVLDILKKIDPETNVLRILNDGRKGTAWHFEFNTGGGKTGKMPSPFQTILLCPDAGAMYVKWDTEGRILQEGTSGGEELRELFLLIAYGIKLRLRSRVTPTS